MGARPSQTVGSIITKARKKSGSRSLNGGPRGTSSPVEEFLRYVVGKLIDYPDELIVTQKEADGAITYYLAMRKTDLPKVIGKGGHTIQALRSLLQASAQKKGHQGRPGSDRVI